MNNVTQIGNNISGDQAGNDIYKNNALVVISTPSTAITELNDKYLQESAQEKSISEIIADLNHLTMALPYAKLDLEQKLTQGNREIEIDEALFLKERIAKKIMELSRSITAQQIIAHTLAKIKQSFRLKILPAIRNGRQISDVDKILYDEVLKPVYDFLEINPLHLNDDDLRGMIFFLSGNCHIDWS